MIARRKLLAYGGIISVSLAAAPLGNAQVNGVWIITEEEAALPESPADQAERSITRGPMIRRIAPSGTVTSRQPFLLKVEFTGRGGEKINPASASVVVLRGNNIDVTPRLKAYIAATGIEISNALMPSGNHILQIKVSDVAGRQTTSQFTIDAR